MIILFHLENIEEEEDKHMQFVSLQVFQETSWKRGEKSKMKKKEW